MDEADNPVLSSPIHEVLYKYTIVKQDHMLILCAYFIYLNIDLERHDGMVVILNDMHIYAAFFFYLLP